MIHWVWLIPAFMFGGFFGVCTMALFVAAKWEDTVAVKESSRTTMNVK